ncbi:RraA family protein [Pseudomonas sp. MWU16-30317]|uniref:RraA family protein n=1 Tax=Pseudomonas sp. MWU16-30317 TaxID=2878095 RepID=UPI001CFBA3B6|nr:RraA family protein [Pseudomonas sp. MWU16-30317]
MSVELEAKLQRVSFATLGHFLEEGFVSHLVRSQLTGVKVVGRARTLRLVNADAFAVNHALVSLLPGEVLVIDMQGDHHHACVGTVTACAATAKGARAIVVDGVVTDIVELRAAGLPIFARGTSLLTTKLRSDPASAQNVEIQCGGVTVVPGAWVLGDDNGLLIASTEALEAVIDIALASDAAEPALLERMQDGEAIETVLRMV